nr:hypothetical protein [Tanacetum cinerariifolium]
MQHPVDGKALKNFGNMIWDFEQNKEMFVTTYNLPPWLCMKETSLKVTLLIPGLKSPRNDIDVCLRPFIDDLIELWKPEGVKTIDAITGKEFKIRAMLSWTISDFPTRSSLSRWSGQGYKACFTCNKDTLSERVLDAMHNEIIALEILLGTLLMNDKSKDTTKARQDLKALGIQNVFQLDKN